MAENLRQLARALLEGSEDGELARLRREHAVLLDAVKEIARIGYHSRRGGYGGATIKDAERIARSALKKVKGSR